jgi:hypothetical protein
MMWNTQDAEESFRNKAIWGAAAVVVLCAVGAGFYYRYYLHTHSVPAVATRPPAAAPVTEPAIRNPIPADTQASDEKALPSLSDSD